MSRDTKSIGIAFRDQFLENAELLNCTLTTPTIAGATLTTTTLTSPTITTPTVTGGTLTSSTLTTPTINGVVGGTVTSQTFTALTTTTATIDGAVITGAGTSNVLTLPISVTSHVPVAINATATATASQVASGYITSTSAAATTITLPTGTLLGAALGAVQGTVHDLYIDNTAGANTVTIAVAVNGILSALAAAEAGGSGLLTVASGVTGQARFTLMFSSATAYTFTRTA
jgi:hypothetical protein